MITATSLYVGSAWVVGATGRSGYIEVSLPTGDCRWARMALAFSYRPVGGDEVLVIAHENEQLFVIGLLKGSGHTTLKVPGNLSIEAPNGSVTILSKGTVRVESAQTVETVAPRVTVRAGRLDVITKQFVQKAENVYHWVSELFQIKTRRLRAVSDESCLVKARRAHMKSEGDFFIDGKTIHLG